MRPIRIIDLGTAMPILATLAGCSASGHSVSGAMRAPDGTSLLMARDLGAGRVDHLLLDPEGGPATLLPWEADTNLSWQRVFSP